MTPVKNLERLLVELSGKMITGEQNSLRQHLILKCWEEAVGILHRLNPDQGGLIAEVGPVVLLLPPELEEDLQPLLGRRIAILRTDNRYVWRTCPVKEDGSS